MQPNPESRSCPLSSETSSKSPGPRWWGACSGPATQPQKAITSPVLSRHAVFSVHHMFTFFTWLAAVLVDMEVGSRLVVFRLLFKLFMSSRFLAFSANMLKSVFNNKIRKKTSVQMSPQRLTRLCVAL